jgi:hypothetical protein
MILLGATMIVAPERAVAQAATSTSVSVRSRTPSASRDSLRTRRERLLIRFDSLRNEYEHERMSVEERDALAREMRRTMLALQESFGDVSVEMRAFGAAGAGGAGMQDRSMFIAKRRSATRGYLGVSFDGPNVDEVRGNERIIRFLDYPRIALVEPSSPAERAGIVEGDTLLELNGTDVRDRAISLTRMLVPQQRVRMRVRRDGNPREFRVTVAEAPGYVMSRTTPLPPMVMATPMPSTAPTPPARVRVYAGDVPQPMPAPPAIAATPGSAIAMTWVMQDGVAGARLESIGEGLGRALGTRYGVLVLRAAPGTPAFDSGLRDGDVILKVAGESVRSVRDLREAMQDADEDVGVKLVVLRDRKSREITLRWQ